MTDAGLSSFVPRFLGEFLAAPEHNGLGPGTAERAWQDFVVGYSSGRDDYYSFWKEHIGDFHWSPAEAFALRTRPEAQDRGVAALAPTDRGGPAPPEELTVISWALSHTDQTKADNREETRTPSERWARSRVYGQKHNRAMHRALVAALAGQGYSAVAPALLPEHAEMVSDDYGRASNWSERHVAYTSGLGTFGLSGGLITPLGQAVRLGSVVVHARVPPTERPYTGAFDYCLYFNGGGCTRCADRCPATSMVDGVRDKSACSRHLEGITAPFVESEYGFKGYGCGLCQTGVPCASRIPPR